MKKFIVLALLAVATIFNGCKDLDLPPTSELAFDLANQSTSNLEGILNGGYGRLIQIGAANAANSSYFDQILYAEAMSGRNTVISSAAGAGQNTFQFHNFLMQPNNNQLSNLSRNLYSIAAMANTVLELATQTPPADADFAGQKDRLMGESFFMRGTVFFLTTRLWAHQFGHNSTAPGGGIMIPLERSKDGTVGVSRATVAQNYEQIIKDLSEAVRLLPVAYDPVVHGNYPAYRFRATKAAALAMLSRVYFQQGTRDSYQLALATINRVIGSTPGAITATPETGNRVYTLQADVKVPFSSTGFVTPANNTEEILRLVNNTTPTQGYTAASLSLSNESGGNPANTGATRWFLRRPTPNPPLASAVTASPLFDDVVNDRRFTELTQNISLVASIGNQRVSRKWGQLTGSAVGQLNSPMLRSAELVMTRAEINAVQGNLDAALADYNLIRRRAITGYTNRTLSGIGTGTAADLLAEIVRERQREMLFEGDDFWAWKRMGAFNAQNAGTYPAAEVAPLVRSGVTLNWNSNRTLLKWHVDDLTLNPQLGTTAQNPD
ncbi:hypothetical protein GCM10023189_54860 [Nibrella saemangeumensis]|uniref:RagB/SusD family nutrient uptake outer membrane protein n=1 Tax=Nibrella saemangeumensis TaxID=1084526 RepID=A0ABP8NPT0_9BACT